MKQPEAFRNLDNVFENEKDVSVYPSNLFNHLGELSPTLIGEYLMDVLKIEEEEAFEWAIEFIESNEKYKARSAF